MTNWHTALAAIVIEALMSASLISLGIWQSRRKKSPHGAGNKNAAQKAATSAAVMHLRIDGKGDKLRYVPLHPGTAEAIDAYLALADHASDTQGALFRTVSNNIHASVAAIPLDGVYKMLAGYAPR